MARHNDTVIGVRLDGFLHVLDDGCFDFVPGIAEATVDVAFIAPVHINSNHIPIGFPISIGDGTANGKDDEVVGGVDGDVARVVEFLGVFEFGKGGCGGGFDERAVSGGAG